MAVERPTQFGAPTLFAAGGAEQIQRGHGVQAKHRIGAPGNGQLDLAATDHLECIADGLGRSRAGAADIDHRAFTADAIGNHPRKAVVALTQ
ncbi:hypothetical protein D3C75_1023910 [compost metagenome]